jgi:hypothetical protein
MRLYPRDVSTGSVVHGGVRYEPAEDGGFDFPGDVSDSLHSFHVRGEPMWETSIERQRRLIAEEAARRADPRTLLDAVEKLVAQAEAGSPAAAEPAKAPPAAKTAAGK